MKAIRIFLTALLVCGPAWANPNFLSNPQSPYPPACAWLPDPDRAEDLETLAVKFYDSDVDLFHAQTGDPIPFRIKAYRAPCSEANRSLVWLEFILSRDYAGDTFEVGLPTVVAEIASGQRFPMSLASEPNGWGSAGLSDFNQTYIVSEPRGPEDYLPPESDDKRWVFLLDNGPVFGWEWMDLGYLAPTEYNAGFTLVLRNYLYDYVIIDVPATRDVLPDSMSALPLSGRLSGVWVTQGAADQGMQLAVSEKVVPWSGTGSTGQPPLVVFLAHYTFDADGNMLWLTGNTEFEMGVRRATIPMVRASNGRFRGAVPASREQIGSVKIRSVSCNDLRIEYDYGDLGLGQGTRKLQRLYSLETAGHDCRDLEAKVAAQP